MEEFHLHLVSDATGETVQTVARACLVQFEGAQAAHGHHRQRRLLRRHGLETLWNQ